MAIETTFLDAVIPLGTSTSSIIRMASHRPFAIYMPAAWDAANLSFDISADAGVTYQHAYYEDGTEIVVTASQSRFIMLEPAKWLGVQTFVIRSGLTGAFVNQTSSRALRVVGVA